MNYNDTGFDSDTGRWNTIYFLHPLRLHESEDDLWGWWAGTQESFTVTKCSNQASQIPYQLLKWNENADDLKLFIYNVVIEKKNQDQFTSDWLQLVWMRHKITYSIRSGSIVLLNNRRPNLNGGKTALCCIFYFWRFSILRIIKHSALAPLLTLLCAENPQEEVEEEIRSWLQSGKGAQHAKSVWGENSFGTSLTIVYCWCVGCCNSNVLGCSLFLITSLLKYFNGHFLITVFNVWLVPSSCIETKLWWLWSPQHMMIFTYGH